MSKRSLPPGYPLGKNVPMQFKNNQSSIISDKNQYYHSMSNDAIIQANKSTIDDHTRWGYTNNGFCLPQQVDVPFQPATCQTNGQSNIGDYRFLLGGNGNEAIINQPQELVLPLLRPYQENGYPVLNDPSKVQSYFPSQILMEVNNQPTPNSSTTPSYDPGCFLPDSFFEQYKTQPEQYQFFEEKQNFSPIQCNYCCKDVSYNPSYHHNTGEINQRRVSLLQNNLVNPSTNSTLAFPALYQQAVNPNQCYDSITETNYMNDIYSHYNGNLSYKNDINNSYREDMPKQPIFTSENNSLQFSNDHNFNMNLANQILRESDKCISGEGLWIIFHLLWYSRGDDSKFYELIKEYSRNKKLSENRVNNNVSNPSLHKKNNYYSPSLTMKSGTYEQAVKYNHTTIPNSNLDSNNLTINNYNCNGNTNSIYQSANISNGHVPQRLGSVGHQSTNRIPNTMTQEVELQIQTPTNLNNVEINPNPLEEQHERITILRYEPLLHISRITSTPNIPESYRSGFLPDILKGHHFDCVKSFSEGSDIYGYYVRHFILPNLHLEMISNSFYKQILMCHLGKIDSSYFFIQNFVFQLQNMEYFAAFLPYGNEQKVTRNGRSMFPRIELIPKNLEPDTLYSFCIIFCPITTDDMGGDTVNITIKDDQPHCIEVENKNNFKPGSYWMKNHILFDEIKLTNNPKPDKPENRVILNSSNKYVLKLKINVHKGSTTCEEILESYCGPINATRFTARTAYTYAEITEMKICANKYAHGERRHQGICKNRRDNQHINFYKMCPECESFISNISFMSSFSENDLFQNEINNFIRYIPFEGIYGIDHSDNNLLMKMLHAEIDPNYIRCPIFMRWRPNQLNH